MPTVSFVISAIKSRQHLVNDLLKMMPSAKVCLDDPLSGTSWTNYRRALSTADTSADWLLSVDDDALVCDDFEAAITRALSACPGDVANFFWRLRRPPSGVSWLSHTRVLHGLVWAVRTSVAKAIVDWVDEAVPSDFVSGDQRLMAWTTYTGRKVFQSAVSLVNHHPVEVSTLAHSLGRPNSPNPGINFRQDVSDVVWDSSVRHWADPRATFPFSGFTPDGVWLPPDAVGALHSIYQQGGLKREYFPTIVKGLS